MSIFLTFVWPSSFRDVVTLGQGHFLPKGYKLNNFASGSQDKQHTKYLPEVLPIGVYVKKKKLTFP